MRCRRRVGRILVGCPVSCRRLCNTQAALAPALLLLSLLLAAPTSAQQKQVQEAPGEPEKFSCAGRVPGYYADPATGCQVYYMCGAGGRQFMYRCPEHTLFQQRMMVCDHWFMVDCKASASHYSANLLIGDKTKPFVGPGETVIRELVATPSPAKARTSPSSFDFGRKKSTLLPFLAPIKRKDQQPPPPQPLVATQRRDQQQRPPLPLIATPSVDRRNRSRLADTIERFTFPTTLFSKPTLAPPLSPFAINTQITSIAPPSTPAPAVTVRALLARASQLIAQTTTRPRHTTPSVTILPPSNPRRPTPEFLDPEITNPSISHAFDPEAINRMQSTPTAFDAEAINRISIPTTSKPLGLSATTLSQIRASLNVSREPVTTERPRLTTLQEDEDLLQPATINSLLRDSLYGEPALLQIIPDTRRMFFIPTNRGSQLDDVSQDYDNLQNLDFEPVQRRDAFRGMRFHSDVTQLNNGGCPPKCFPAFFRPGSCEPCVILR